MKYIYIIIILLIYFMFSCAKNEDQENLTLKLLTNSTNYVNGNEAIFIDSLSSLYEFSDKKISVAFFSLYHNKNTKSTRIDKFYSNFLKKEDLFQMKTDSIQKLSNGGMDYTKMIFSEISIESQTYKNCLFLSHSYEYNKYISIGFCNCEGD